MCPARRPSKLVVLLVEDDPDDQMLIRVAFERARPKFRVRLVTSAEAAVAYLSGQPPYEDRARDPVPSLILVDLGLPGMSGLDLLKWIRSRQEYRDVPAVVLSGSNLRADMTNAYGAGSNSFLVKPAGGKAFMGMMESLCSFWERNVS